MKHKTGRGGRREMGECVSGEIISLGICVCVSVCTCTLVIVWLELSICHSMLWFPEVVGCHRYSRCVCVCVFEI